MVALRIGGIMHRRLEVPPVALAGKIGVVAISFCDSAAKSRRDSAVSIR